MSINEMSSRPVIVHENDEDDDVPTLSAETFKALQEFYSECEVAESKKIDENWTMSQFWYDEKTSETLAKEVFAKAIAKLKLDPSATFNIGCISCPTLFKKLFEYMTVRREHATLPDFALYMDRIRIKLFEYDKRFSMYGEDFSFYDYKNPLEVKSEYEGFFDLIVADPPYLSQECHIKTGMSIRLMGKDAASGALKLIICTGAIMEDLLASSLKVKLVKFVPRHERNLANEFKCYANYETLFLDQ